MIPCKLTLFFWSGIMKKNESYQEKRIENELEVTTYLDRLGYALQSGQAKINFQKDRIVDQNRDNRFTNRYTLLNLFPDEDEVEVLKRELAFLTVENYIETVKDTRFPHKSEMRVFEKKYSHEDVYIKIRVELLTVSGNNIFVMSFHFAERVFVDNDFPYNKNKGE